MNEIDVDDLIYTHIGFKIFFNKTEFENNIIVSSIKADCMYFRECNKELFNFLIENSISFYYFSDTGVGLYYEFTAENKYEFYTSNQYHISSLEFNEYTIDRTKYFYLLSLT